MKRLITLFFLLKTLVIYSQNEYNLDKYFGVQVAPSFIFENLPEGREYRPIMLLGYYTITDLLKRKRSNLYVYLEPQLVLVNFNPSTAKEFEFGANLGFEYQLPVGQKSFFTMAIGSGPHYFSTTTDLQAKGYIFSDNFEVGWRQQLEGGNYNLLLKCRFRHISNANLFKPNGGVDNWFLIAGVTKRMRNTFRAPRLRD
jgi:hypothetical protein